MNKAARNIILVAIFLLAVGFRLYLSYQTDNFTNDAYFEIRQIESIVTTGKPIFFDELSFGGRTLVFTPLFHYLTALFVKMFSFIELELLLKAIPNIMAGSVVFIVYMLTFEITKKKVSSLWAAFISAFIPAFIAETTNSLSNMSLLVPLTFLAVYFFIKISNDRNYALPFVATCVLLVLTSPISMVLLLAFFIYLLVIYAEHLSFNKAEGEVILFFLFMTVWLYLVIFKKAILLHGSGIIFENIPLLFLSNYFQEINVMKAIVFIGILPLVTGIYIVFRQFFLERKRSLFLLVSFAIAMLLLLWLKLIELRTGLIFGGVILAILFGEFHRVSMSILKKSHFYKFRHIFTILIFAAIIVTSGFPSYYYGMQANENTLSKEEVDALLWLKYNTPKNSVVLSTVDEGHLINFISQRKNVADSNFIMIDDARQRVLDTNEIFTTQFRTVAIRLLNKYDVKYIFFSEAAKETYEIEELQYLDECFEPKYDHYGDFQIYESKCVI